jgi:hypothetical protein
MIIPHYINETKSDMRGIKPVRHAIEDDGNLSSGPFLSLEECVTRITPGCEPQDCPSLARCRPDRPSATRGSPHFSFDWDGY